MHPNNIYSNNPPNFLKLSEFDPALKPFLIPCSTQESGFTIDFKDPEAVRQLNSTLLRKDFNLKLNLPPDRLCPMVPGRLDYCLWVIDLLKSTDESIGLGGVIGIDIGTGSSAIYVLLLSQLLPKAKFIATEIDFLSYQSALLNVKQNGLESLISLTKIESKDSELFPEQEILTKFLPNQPSFSICNPPYYSSMDEISELSSKRSEPSSVICTGSEVEMITEGGEGEFIIRMIKQSLGLRSYIRWFTSLCGKYSTLSQIVEFFKSLNGNNYAINELAQGKTHHWVFAWSWEDYRLPDNLSRSIDSDGPRLKGLSKLLPLPNELLYYLPSSIIESIDGEGLIKKISETLQNIQELPIQRVGLEGSEGNLNPGGQVICSWKISAKKCTWTRSARRNANSKMNEQISAKLDSVLEPALIAKLSLSEINQISKKEEVGSGDKLKQSSSMAIINDETIEPETELVFVKRVEFCWIKGSDRKMFESLWNHIVKKIISKN